ncbi:HEPN domain-containing protein [Streptomyces violaceoruber]
MDSFESDGLFWLPGDDENQVAGKISFDQEKGTRLSLIGSFSEPQFGAEFEADDERPVIYGVAGKMWLTLTGCSRVSAKHEIPGIYREDYRADGLFAGQVLLDADNPTFREVSFGQKGLFDWVAKNAVRREYKFSESNRRLESATLTLDTLPSEECRAEGCTIALYGTWKLLGSTQNPGFEQDTRFTITYDREVDFVQVRSDVAGMQDMLTCLTDVATVPVGVSLCVRSKDDEGEARKQRVEFYGQNVAYSEAKSKKVKNAILNFEQIGGLPAVARWLDFNRSRRVVLGQSLASKYRPMYVENRFLNSVSAAETLHRLEFPNEVKPAGEYKSFRKMLVRYVPKKYRGWLSQQLAYSNEPRLRHRLRELASHGEIAAVLGCDPEDWASAVTNARNRMIHHDEEKGSAASSTELYWLSESLRLAVLLSLMRFCEFKEGVLQDMAAHDSVKFVAERVHEVLNGSLEPGE